MVVESYLKLYRLDTSGFSSPEKKKALLDNAYSHATKFGKCSEPVQAADHALIADILVEKANFELDGVKKCSLYRRAIWRHEQIVRDWPDAENLRAFGKVLVDYLDHCLDFRERIQVKNKALRHLRQAYELEKDEDTLESIKELEQMAG